MGTANGFDGLTQQGGGTSAAAIKQDGYAAGEVLGFTQGLNTLTPAISDGLRYGSPECGRAMQALKALTRMDQEGTIEEVEEDLLGTSLLEKAGLEKPKTLRRPGQGRTFDPAEFLLGDDDED